MPTVVFIVKHSEDGEFIGHGLYRQIPVQDGVFFTEEAAREWIEAKNPLFDDDYWIEKHEVRG